MRLVTLDKASFDEARLGQERPLLVEFGADWCGPCHQMDPVLVRLAEELGDRLDVATIDFDDNLEIGRRYEVMSLPTLILFVHGEPVRRLTGARGLARLREELDTHLVTT
jgi:thioredoxin 1